jgi:TRAP-type C4-dicarboxylate transport system permease small subunit
VPAADPAPAHPLIAGLLRVVRAVLGTLILVGVLLNFANVVGRYLFFRPIMWAEEVLVFIMVWCVLLGATIVTWEGRHLRMDAFYNLAPPRARRALNAFTTLVFLGVAIFVLVQSLAVTSLIARNGQRSVVAEIPMAVPYAAIPVSFALIVLFILWRFRTFVRADLQAVAGSESNGGGEGPR